MPDMSVTQTLFRANILLMIAVSSAAPVDEPISFIQQYFNQKADSDGKYYQARTSNSTNTYRKRKTEEGYISLCWAESLIATEDRKTKNTTLSKRYSIILESPIDLDRQVIERNNISCYQIIGNDTNETKVYNVTTIKVTDEYVVKEHKTLFCGAGPVLSEHFIAWPKLNKKQIEISINPLSTSQWRDCNKTMGDLVPTVKNDSRSETIPIATLRSIKRKRPQLEFASVTTGRVETAKDTLGNPEVVGDYPTIEETSEEDETEIEDGNVPILLEDESRSKSLMNFLLKRDVNCTSDFHSELCEELLRHSGVLEDFRNNSSPAMVNLFFPNGTFLDFFRDFGGNNTFDVRGKFILEVKANSSKNDETAEKMVSRIEVIEDSMVSDIMNNTNFDSI